MTFKRHGFTYNQLQRVGDVAILAQSKPDLSRVWFEVVIVQRHDGHVIHGQNVPPAEYMPSAETWGRFGFTFRDNHSAQAKFDALVAARARVQA